MINPEIKNEMKSQTSGYMMTAFGLVAGLAWNDAIKSLIDFIYPFSGSNSLWAKFIYAVGITIVVILVGKYVFKQQGTK